MKNNLKNLGLVLKITLQVFSIIGILFLLGLYSITKLLNLHFDLFIVMIYPCGICFLYLVYQFINLFDSLKNNNPFCYENVKRLSNSMICSLLICILVLIALIISIFYEYYSLQLKVAVGFISILFFAFGIALLILSELFKQATMYKEENDLTI